MFLLQSSRTPSHMDGLPHMVEALSVSKEKWIKFYKELGLDVRDIRLRIPRFRNPPQTALRPVIIASGINISMAFDVIKECNKNVTYSEIEDLLDTRQKERSYAFWTTTGCRPCPTLEGSSPKYVRSKRIQTETLLERLILESFDCYFGKINSLGPQHPEENSVMCADSHIVSTGGAPLVKCNKNSVEVSGMGPNSVFPQTSVKRVYLIH